VAGERSVKDLSTVSFDADLYRVLHRGVSGDVAFYRSVCEGAGRALELGCGDGRVTLPLARWGVEITGIDNHPGMLAAANAERAREPEAIQARLRYIEGDICDFDLGARFDRIIAPYTTLYALRPKDRAACLRCVGRHLAPGGRFVFDAYPADSMPEDGSYTDLKPVWITRVIRDQQVIDVYERDRHDAVSQQVSVTYRYRIEDADWSAGGPPGLGQTLRRWIPATRPQLAPPSTSRQRTPSRPW